MTVMFLLPMLVMLLPFQDAVLVELFGGLSWGSCAPHAQANTNFRDLPSSPCSGSGKRLNREEELLPLGAELSGLALPLPQLR